MKNIKLILCLLLSLSAIPAYSQFTPVPDSSANSTTAQLLNMRRNESNASIAQVTVVDPAGFVDGGTIMFPTLDGNFIYLNLQSIQSDNVGLYFRAATSDSSAQGFFSIRNGYALNGSVSIGGDGTYISIESVDGGGNQHVISKYSRVRPALTPPTGNPNNETPRGGSKYSGPQASGSGPAPVDILFVYTSPLGPTNFAVDNAITSLNISFSESRDFNSSDTKVKGKKVGLERVSLSLSSNADTQLSILRQDAAVQRLRDQYSADIVVLLASNAFINSTDTPGQLAGIAYQTPQPEFGYAVVGTQFLSTPYVFAHEIGHILGATHERAYIHYKTQAEPYCIRTIMSYPTNCLSFNDVLQPNNFALPINEFSNQRGNTYVSGVGIVPSGNASANNWDYIGANNWRVASFREPFLKTLNVSPQSVNLFVGDTVVFNAVGVDNQGNGTSTQGLVWSSANTAVTTISPSGVANIVGPGQTTIQASVGTVTAVVPVNAQAKPVGTVEVSPTQATLTGNNVASISIAVAVRDPQGAVIPGAVVTWSSSNTAVATVDSNGFVVANSSGTVVITASSGGKSATVTITAKIKSCTSNCK